MRRATSNTLEPGMILHSGRRLSGNGWHDASFVYERVGLYTQQLDVMYERVRKWSPARSFPPLALLSQGGERAESGLRSGDQGQQGYKCEQLRSIGQCLRTRWADGPFQATRGHR